MWIVYTPDGLTLEETQTDSQTNVAYTQLVKIPSTVMKQLQADVKVDITPKSAFDKYAQELSLENLLKGGFFNPQMIPQLKLYVNALSDDSVMPKQKLLDIIEQAEEEQRKIAEINAKAQMLKQRASQFINNDIHGQASQIATAQQEVGKEEVQPEETYVA